MKHTLAQIALHTLYLFSCLVPRKKQQYSCVGWHKKIDGEVFADNAKYFFLHLSKKSDIRAIWIAKSEALALELRSAGLESYYAFSVMGIWSILRSGTIVIDAFLQPETFCLSGRSRIVQLLHGKGMKKGGYAKHPPRKQDHIFSTSSYALSILPSIFKEESALHVTGYPRNDVLLDTCHPHALISVDTEMKNHLEAKKSCGNKIVLYAPTFRRGQKFIDLSPHLPVEQLVAWARDHHVHIVLSLHNKYRLQQTRTQFNDHLSYLAESDIYPLLPLVDVLVTDYSSLFVDYLLLDRSILFYCFDLAEYSQKEGIIGDYMSITPGPKVRTFDELLFTLTQCLTEDDAHWKAERRRVRDLYHAHQDAHSSERVFRTLQQ